MIGPHLIVARLGPWQVLGGFFTFDHPKGADLSLGLGLEIRSDPAKPFEDRKAQAPRYLPLWLSSDTIVPGRTAGTDKQASRAHL